MLQKNTEKRGWFGYSPPAPPFSPSPAPEKPPAREPLGAVTASLDANVGALKGAFFDAINDDFTIRLIEIAGKPAALLFLDGMVDRAFISEAVLKPMLIAAKQRGAAAADIADIVAGELTVHSVTQTSDLNQASDAIMDGMCALIVEDCASCALIDARGYDKRAVGEPFNENLILGPHEAFTENLRSNTSQIRRIFKKSSLITEMMAIGTETRTMCALMYDKAVVNPGIVEEARRRIQGIQADIVPGAGYIQQLIEDKPFSLFPQMAVTERPDRAVSYIVDGQVIIICDGSPYAMAAPITFWHLMNTPDDTFMRWQYGTFLRLLRTVGAFLSLYLTALYLACTLYHTAIIPTELLLSISETHARVPFPMLVQVLLMEFSFDLIQEAGLRVPGVMGSALGIIGALIMGQAAVAADIISPILIIIVALAGLGGFSVPDYSLGLGLRLARIAMILAAAMLGFIGITIVTYVGLVILCSRQSFGVPFFAPFSPSHGEAGDYLIRKPLWAQATRPAFLYPLKPRRDLSGARAWDGSRKGGRP